MGSTSSAPQAGQRDGPPTLPLPRIGAPCLGAGCAGMEKTTDHPLVQENHKTPVSPMGHYHSSMHQAGLAAARRSRTSYLTSKTIKKKNPSRKHLGAQKTYRQSQKNLP